MKIPSNRLDYQLRWHRHAQQHVLAVALYGRERPIHLRIDCPDGLETRRTVSKTYLSNSVSFKSILYTYSSNTYNYDNVDDLF
jgi:hypothetical protein